MYLGQSEKNDTDIFKIFPSVHLSALSDVARLRCKVARLQGFAISEVHSTALFLLQLTISSGLLKVIKNQQLFVRDYMNNTRCVIGGECEII